MTRALRFVAVSIAVSCAATFAAELARAQEPAARVRAAFVPGDGVFVGQRLTLRVELLSSTGFSGTPRFEIPELPGVLVAKLGNPVIGSESIDGVTWSVAMHDFTLFPQRAGDVVVPAFRILLRVTSEDRRESFEREVQVGELRTAARTPPGADGVVGLVTGRKLKVEVRWSPQPTDDAVVGDAFVRQVTIRADEVLGMALPATTVREEPAGLAVYPDRGVVEDRTTRGEFTGVRTDKTTFVCEAPGRVEVPAATIRWFDLDTGAMAAVEVPAVGWSVAPAPVAADDLDDASPGWRWIRWGAAIAVLLAAAVVASQRRLVRRAWNGWRARRAASEPAFFRRALAACRTDDPRAALRETLRWLDRVTTGARSPRLTDLVARAPELAPVLAELEARALGGGAWHGAALRSGLKRVRAARAGAVRPASALPPLNPGR